MGITTTSNLLFSTRKKNIPRQIQNVRTRTPPPTRRNVRSPSPPINAENHKQRRCSVAAQLLLSCCSVAAQLLLRRVNSKAMFSNSSRLWLNDGTTTGNEHRPLYISSVFHC